PYTTLFRSRSDRDGNELGGGVLAGGFVEGRRPAVVALALEAQAEPSEAAEEPAASLFRGTRACGRRRGMQALRHRPRDAGRNLARGAVRRCRVRRRVRVLRAGPRGVGGSVVGT